MNMLETYEHILNTCGYSVNESGSVRKQLSDKTVPVSLTIGEESRLLVLPTKDNLRSDDVMSFVIFHPFVENLARGESKVLSFIRKELTRNYGAYSMQLMDSIVRISAGAVNHQDLSTKQKEFIASMGKMDTKFQENFSKIILALAKHGVKNTAFTLSLRKNFTNNGNKYSRAAVWSSPLADEIYKVKEIADKDKDYSPKVFGVPIRKGDLPILVKVIEAFFPNSQGEHQFFGYSDATDAPYLEAFIRSLKTLPAKTNEIAKTFFKGRSAVYSKEVAEETFNSTYLDIDWIEDDFTVAKWRKEYLLIPMQDGNEGVSPVERETRVEVRPNANKWDTVTEPLKGNVSNTTQPVKEQSSNGYVSFLPKPQPQQQYQPQYQPPVQPQPVQDSMSAWLPNRPARPQYPQQPYGYQGQQYQDDSHLVYRPGIQNGYNYQNQQSVRTGYQSPFDNQSVNSGNFFRR